MNMKLSSRPPRTPSSLSDSVHHQLNSYALVASAAGVGLLALAQPAKAEVVYTPADVGLTGGYYPLDLNHDGTTDFVLLATGWCRSFTCHGTVAFAGSGFPATNAVVPDGSFKYGHHWAAPMWPGVKIDSKRRFEGAFYAPILHSTAVWQTSHQSWSHKFQGPWANDGKGFHGHYLGLKFLINGKFHYGWARLQNQPFCGSFVLTGYAYETIPNKAIITGKTKGPDVITVQRDTAPGSLGRLALGRK